MEAEISKIMKKLCLPELQQWLAGPFPGCNQGLLASTCWDELLMEGSSATTFIL
jgi:hypothetical protein